MAMEQPAEGQPSRRPGHGGRAEGERGGTAGQQGDNSMAGYAAPNRSWRTRRGWGRANEGGPEEYHEMPPAPGATNEGVDQSTLGRWRFECPD